MSVLLAAIQSTVQAVATATPTVTPTPTPTPVEVAAAAQQSQTFLDSLNALAQSIPQSNIIALGSALGVLIQGFLNKIPFLKSAVAYIQDLRRHVVSVVIPTVLTIGASLATGENQLGWMPVLYVLGQIIFYAYQWLKGRMLLAFQAKPEVTNF